MLRDLLWLYRSSCCHRWEHVWKYVILPKQTRISVRRLYTLRFNRVWPLTETANVLLVHYISTVQTSVSQKVWMYLVGKKTNGLKRETEIPTQRHVSLPLQVPQTFLELNMRLSSRCHSDMNLTVIKRVTRHLDRDDQLFNKHSLKQISYMIKGDNRNTTFIAQYMRNSLCVGLRWHEIHIAYA